MIRLHFLKMNTSGDYRPTRIATALNMYNLGYMFACTKERTEENWVSELDETFLYPNNDGIFGDLPDDNTELFRVKYTDMYKEYINGYISGARDMGIPEP